MNRKWIKAQIVLILATVCILSSCATMADYDFSSINSSMLQNDFEAVHGELEQKESLLYSSHDEVLENLDKGIISHYSGESERSNSELAFAEKKIEEFYAFSISQSISSFLVNDTLKDYSGSIYEDIYTNIFMALNYLNLKNFDEAFVEIRRFDNKLKEVTVKNQQLIQNAKMSMKEGSSSVPDKEIKFHNSAFARYLSMLMYRASGDSDNANVDYKMIQDSFALQPSLYDFDIPTSISDDVYVPSDVARLNIVSFTGLSPIKKESVLRLPIGNTYYKLALPEMEKRASRISGANVKITSKTNAKQTVISLEKIESIENIAFDTYQQQYALIFAKALTRSISKAVTTSVLDNQSKKYDGYVGLALGVLSLASSVSTELTERADVRTSRFFPANVSVAGINLEPDLYDVEVNYLDATGRTVVQRFFSDVNVQTGELNLLETICLE